MTTSEYEDHPFSSVLPLMEKAELDELAADIQGNGLRAPITLFEGKILDGRNRYRACRSVGVEPRFRDYNGDGDPIAFIISVNVQRRHLTASQKAMVVAKILDLPRGRPRKKPSKQGKSEKSPQNGELSKTTAEAAKEVGVGHTTVEEAKKVLREGSDETIAQVESGEKSVATAVKEIKKAKKPTLDKIGYPIPEAVLSDWRKAEEFQEVLSSLHRIKLQVEKAVENNELAFREITNSTVGDIEAVWWNLKQVLPYAVCLTCQGLVRETCTVCKQRGFISKFGYENWFTPKVREIREKVIKS